MSTPTARERAEATAKDIIKRSEVVDSGESRQIHYYKIEKLMTTALLQARDEGRLEGLEEAAQYVDRHTVRKNLPENFELEGEEASFYWLEEKIAENIRSLKSGRGE